MPQARRSNRRVSKVVKKKIGSGILRRQLGVYNDQGYNGNARVKYIDEALYLVTLYSVYPTIKIEFKCANWFC